MPIQIVIEEDQEINYEDSVFITGFHGVGWTGYITIRHIIKTASNKRIGYLIDDTLPDIVSIEDERLVLPFEFHRLNNFVIFQPPFQPILAKQQNIIKELAEWITKSNFKEAILVGGLDIRFQKDSEKMRIVPNRATINKAKELDIPFLEKGLMIKGPLALLLTHLEILSFPAIVILPYAQFDRPDPAAAAVAIDFLNKYYQLDLSTSQLRTDAQRIENEIEEILRQERERMEREPRDMYI